MGQMEASEDHHLAGRRSRRHPAGYKSLHSESQRVVTLFPLPAAEPAGFLQVSFRGRDEVQPSGGVEGVKHRMPFPQPRLEIPFG